MCRETYSAAIVPIVFIVDDDEAVRDALSLQVQSCGWNALACANGAEFFAALASAWPSCVVVNVKLSDMDGSALLHEISRLRIDLPVIVTTAYENQPRALRALADGARAVVAKPFGGGELMAAIARLITPSGRAPPAPEPTVHAST